MNIYGVSKNTQKKGVLFIWQKIFMIWTCTILTRRVPKVEQDLFTLLEHLWNLQFFLVTWFKSILF